MAKMRYQRIHELQGHRPFLHLVATHLLQDKRNHVWECLELLELQRMIHH